MRLDDALSPTPILTPSSAGDSAAAGDAAASASSSGFKQAWNDVQSVRTVQAGDNLVSIVRQHAQAQGVNLTDSQTYRYAQSLATSNGMPNANRIYPGQQLNMGALTAQWQEPGVERSPTLNSDSGNAPTSLTAANAPPPSTASVLSAKIAQRPAQPSKLPHAFSAAVPNRASNATIPKSNPQSSTSTGGNTGASILGAPNPVLDKTLDRAVSKGFIPANEKQAVYQKVLQMANKHGFAPDDFARMTLMESDGMNPKASNQRCHGIIQFCDGPARGAAAVGMANNPKSILGLSVYQQLHLTDTYLQKAGLNKQQGSVPLDDLYLSVLQPSARSETRADAPLGIPGNQAGALYNDKTTSNTITRQSLIRGLVQNAQRVLGLDRADVKRPENRAQITGEPLIQNAPQAASAASTSSTSRVQTQSGASYASLDSTTKQLR
jgi:hypothetical protein